MFLFLKKCPKTSIVKKMLVRLQAFSLHFLCIRNSVTGKFGEQFLCVEVVTVGVV